jgi:hypothetical protein
MKEVLEPTDCNLFEMVSAPFGKLSSVSSGNSKLMPVDWTTKV